MKYKLPRSTNLHHGARYVLHSAVGKKGGEPPSHTSIVAREYGIPAVVATGVGTRRIKDGQTITVDGGAGTVELK